MPNPNSPVSAFVAPTVTGGASSSDLGQMFRQQRDMLNSAQHEKNTNVLLQDVLKLLHNHLVIAEKIDLNGSARHDENIRKSEELENSIDRNRKFLTAEVNRLSANVDRLQSSFGKLQQSVEQRMATKEEVASLRIEMNASFQSVMEKMDAAEEQRRIDMAAMREQVQLFLEQNSL
ncbi:hypothetical protein [Caballeronia sp. TF1N1]|uniref:hypothetical protein n=1 Tax=Caballeronia sp. TF1N1 TaxID=2878153 RepID=UPI001FD2349A|nr:hypothetical protein [Caballeronia sp. TF1N1]